MSDLAFALTFAAALGCALAAGVFYAFSTFVMAALDRGSAATAVATMQGINRTAPEPPLMALLLGTAVLGIAVAVLDLLGDAGAHGGLAVAAAAIYLFGVFGVTMACNVPLNERLDRVDALAPAAAEDWSTFSRRWRPWNHVRTLSGVLATAGMVAALAG